MDIKAILAPIGLVIVALALAMLAPTITDIAADNSDWQVFLTSGLVSGFFGASLFLGFRTSEINLRRREALAFVVLVWVAIVIVGALPFYFSEIGVTFGEAIFESASGLTTTGATVLTNLDLMAPGILVWRSMLHWIGGIGIVVISVFLFPFLSVGGQQLFTLESSERADRPFARFSEFAQRLLQLYLFLTIACIGSYLAAGMDFFNAFNHALTTVSSGGFSTSDRSLGQFESEAVLWVASAFMLAAGLPFVWMLRFVARQKGNPDPQVWAFLWFIGLTSFVLIGLLTLTDTPSNYSVPATVVFHTLAIVTTTGFAAEDYMIWPQAALMIVFFTMFLGGCAGSTSGGIKFFRLVLIQQSIVAESGTAVFPNRIVTPRYGRKALDVHVFRGALFFLAAYFLVFAVGAVLLSFAGLDFLTALSGSIAMLGNVGPGLGDVIGPTGHYGTLPSFAQWVMIVLMLLGRLEILAVFALLTPTFWRS